MFFANLFKRKGIKSIRANENISNLNTTELSKVEKETIMVQKVTSKDMEQFTMIPYQLNCPVKKFIRPGGHPFAYMDLNQANQIIAKDEIRRINEYINQAKDYVPRLPKRIDVCIEKIMFNPYSKDYGYTRLICTPYTFSGKKSKYPLHLHFMTRIDIEDCDIGKIYYGQDGKILKANISIWRNHTGWLFTFKTIGRTLVLYEIKSNICPDESGQPTTIYKFVL